MPGGLQIANRSGRNPAAAAWKLRRGHRVDVVESFPAGSRCWRSRTAVSRSRRKTDIWCKAGSGDPRSGSHRFPGVRSVGRNYAGAQRDARGEGRRNAKDRDGRTGAFEGEFPFCTPFRSSLLSYRIFSGFGAGSLGLRAWDLGLRAWDLGFGAWCGWIPAFAGMTSRLTSHFSRLTMDPRVRGDGKGRSPFVVCVEHESRNPFTPEFFLNSANSKR